MPAAVACGGPSLPVTLALQDLTASGASPRAFSLGGYSGLIGGHHVSPANTSLGGVDDQEYFYLQDGAPSNFEARATVNSGSVNSGTTGSWVQLPHTWSTNSACNLTIEVGAYGTSTALDSCTVDLSS